MSCELPERSPTVVLICAMPIFIECADFEQLLKLLLANGSDAELAAILANTQVLGILSMFRDYKTFAILTVSCLILLSSLDSTEVTKERVPSKCCSLIEAQIIILSSSFDIIAFVLLNGSTERLMT